MISKPFLGKSSVLHAVTEVPFDTGDGMCTHFATEIILQRTLPDEPTETKIRIIPDVKESSERREKLEAWRPDSFDKFAILDKTTMQNIVKQVHHLYLQTFFFFRSLTPNFISGR
jgi:hypothetical protein